MTYDIYFNNENYIFETNCPIFPTGYSKKIAPELLTVLNLYEMKKEKFI